MLRRRFGPDTERGVSAVEFAMLMPIFLPLIFLLVQAGLYFHASNVTQAVAQTTGRVLRTYPGDAGVVRTDLPSQGELQGQADRVAVEAWESLDANRTSARPTTEVDVDAGGTNFLTVTVHSKCINLLPGLFPDLDLQARSSGPIEIFKPQDTN